MIKIRVSARKRANFIKSNGPRLKRKFNRYFLAMIDTVTADRVRRARDSYSLDEDWKGEINMFTEQFMTSEFWPLLTTYMIESGSTMYKRIQREKKAFTPVSESIRKFVEEEALYFVIEATTGMIDRAREVIMKGVMNNLSVRNLQILLKQIFPLTSKGHAAVLNYYDALVSEGVNMDRVARQTQKYADSLRNLRAETIARTETSRAYSAGQQEGVRQAIEDGIIKEARKKWVDSGDDRVRDAHSELGNQPPVPIDQPYSNGDMYAGYAINCRCVDEYIMD